CINGVRALSHGGMLSDTPLFLHIVFNNVCVKVVHYWPACTRRTGLARKQIDKIFTIDPEPRRF
ncbi:hypothetical protein J8J32_21230, partial [Mycobacterium tuberculosis]|uniref:hypothetical protein n=1 Tax=Mycobacterium tuberculosis TaxID=1773 RepID=UPI001AE0D920